MHIELDVLVAILGSLGTIAIGSFMLLFRIGSKVGDLNSTLKNLSDDVEKLDITISNLDKWLTKHEARLSVLEANNH